MPSTSLGLTFDDSELTKPAMMKDYLVALAKRELPQTMGERYEEIVVNCLTCLDKINVDFGDQKDFEDVDGVVVGARYIGKVRIWVSPQPGNQCTALQQAFLNSYIGT